MYAIRGAITIKKNTPEDIARGTKELFTKIIDKNNLTEEELVSIIFSATKDIDQAYPAKTVRDLGYLKTPLFCLQEMHVKNSLAQTIRVLVNVNPIHSVDKIKHVYLGEAKALRPDLLDKDNQSESSNFAIDNFNLNNHHSTIPIELGRGRIIGGKDIIIMAGPCAVENKKQIFAAAETAALSGATCLRGGAFKPRTSPHSFQGLGEEGLKLLRSAADQNQLAVVTEILDPRHLSLIANYTDIFQIGARNMHNYYLLKEVGKQNKPVLLKRNMSATYKELLLAAEYIKQEGNQKIILCERGIRTFNETMRNTLDIMSVPLLKKISPYPIVVDPSHGTGYRELIGAAGRAAIAAGADGLIIEIHPQPEKALSDGKQSIRTSDFQNMVLQFKEVANAVNRTIGVE